MPQFLFDFFNLAFFFNNFFLKKVDTNRPVRLHSDSLLKYENMRFEVHRIQNCPISIDNVSEYVTIGDLRRTIARECFEDSGNQRNIRMVYKNRLLNEHNDNELVIQSIDTNEDPVVLYCMYKLGPTFERAFTVYVCPICLEEVYDILVHDPCRHTTCNMCLQNIHYDKTRCHTCKRNVLSHVWLRYMPANVKIFSLSK